MCLYYSWGLKDPDNYGLQWEQDKGKPQAYFVTERVGVVWALSAVN